MSNTIKLPENPAEEDTITIEGEGTFTYDKKALLWIGKYKYIFPKMMVANTGYLVLLANDAIKDYPELAEQSKEQLEALAYNYVSNAPMISDGKFEWILIPKEKYITHAFKEWLDRNHAC